MAGATQGNSDTWPIVDHVEVAVTPDDGSPRLLHSVQVGTDAKLKLTWTSKHAKSVRIDGLGSFGASGSVAIPTQDASYKLVALGDQGQESLPFEFDVHTHEPGEVYSQHAEVRAPAKHWMLDFGIHH